MNDTLAAKRVAAIVPLAVLPIVILTMTHGISAIPKAWPLLREMARDVAVVAVTSIVAGAVLAIGVTWMRELRNHA